MLWTKLFVALGIWTVGFKFEGEMVGIVIQAFLFAVLVLLIREYVRARRQKRQLIQNKKDGRAQLRREYRLKTLRENPFGVQSHTLKNPSISNP